MRENLYVSYWREVGEFRKEIKKIVIPFNKFFRVKEHSINNSPIIKEIDSII